MSDDKFLDNINPKFRAWYEKQDEAVQGAIRARWDRLFKQEELVRMHALQSALLTFCAGEHGYDFTT
jgi:hypothetical protein